MIRFLLALAMTFTFSFANAQPQGENSLRAWKRDTAIVLFSAVGGGILGLSTLSFYGQPQEHTSNVGLGALIGLVGGVSYILWESSQRPQTFSLIEQRGEPALLYTRSF